MSLCRWVLSKLGVALFVSLFKCIAYACLKRWGQGTSMLHELARSKSLNIAFAGRHSFSIDPHEHVHSFESWTQLQYRLVLDISHSKPQPPVIL